mmetsp:Transcript_28840/g.46393  ORF Transcript_28840/g.46393 Transcript_28840/m.46393 type:complete len:227 (+) Transcript_28840:489-1169(+)
MQRHDIQSSERHDILSSERQDPPYLHTSTIPGARHARIGLPWHSYEWGHQHHSVTLALIRMVTISRMRIQEEYTSRYLYVNPACIFVCMFMYVCKQGIGVSIYLSMLMYVSMSTYVHLCIMWTCVKIDAHTSLPPAPPEAPPLPGPAITKPWPRPAGMPLPTPYPHHAYRLQASPPSYSIPPLVCAAPLCTVAISADASGDPDWFGLTMTGSSDVMVTPWNASITC